MEGREVVMPEGVEVWFGAILVSLCAGAALTAVVGRTLDIGDAFALFGIGVGAGVVYFIPTMAAVFDCFHVPPHPYYRRIFFVNLLLGWTLVGWIAALIWARSR